MPKPALVAATAAVLPAAVQALAGLGARSYLEQVPALEPEPASSGAVRPA
jgi:hypothetical protein